MSRFGNERDLEIGQVIDFIKKHPSIKTTLDVGSRGSAALYAEDVQKLVSVAYGIDILDDDDVLPYLKHNWVGNVTDYEELQVMPADLVFSISSIEHSGISTYETDWENERVRVFKAMYDLANKYLVVTCPFGKPMFIQQQYANITPDDLRAFEKVIGKHIYARFYFTPAQNSEFTEISYQEACKVEFDPEIGIPRCIAILKVEK